MKIRPCLARLRAHLESASYTLKVTDRYLAVAGHFLRFLDKKDVPVGSARPEHVHAYLLEALRIYRRTHGHRRPTEANWRPSHTSGIHQEELVGVKWT